MRWCHQRWQQCLAARSLISSQFSFGLDCLYVFRYIQLLCHINSHYSNSCFHNQPLDGDLSWVLGCSEQLSCPQRHLLVQSLYAGLACIVQFIIYAPIKNMSPILEDMRALLSKYRMTNINKPSLRSSSWCPAQEPELDLMLRVK